MMEDALRDLSDVTRASASIKLKVRSELIEVTEVTMENLAPFIRACSPFFQTFDQLTEVKEVGADLTASGGNTRQMNDKFGFFKMISENAAAFLDAAALVCEVKGGRSFLARLRPDEFFHIALAVVEVNGDFFILRLAPALQKFLNGVGRIGMSPSSVSLLLATENQSFSNTATPNSSDTSVH